MPNSVIDVVHCLSRRNKGGFTYTYDDNVIISDDVPNDPHAEDEASDDENNSDYVHDDNESSDKNNDSDYIYTEPMYRTDIIVNPHYIDDASYGDPIAGVEDHVEEPRHEENTDGRH